MNTNLASILHHQAVRLAEEADMAKAKFTPIDFRELYNRAFLFEKEAAMMQTSQEFAPLPRHTLLRSAAALAFKAGNFSESEKIIALARSENPPIYESEKLDEIETLVQEATASQILNGHFQITGTFSAVNSEEKEIKIRDSKSQRMYAFVVPPRMFRQVVKSYLLEMVSAVGKSSPSGVLTLEKITLVA